MSADGGAGGGGAGWQLMDAANQFTSVQVEDAVLGKRTREDSPPKVDRVLRPRKNQR